MRESSGEMPALVCRSRMLALVALLWSVDALAQETAPIELTWTGPPACSDNGEVRAQIDAMLGASAHPPATPIVADAQAELLSDGRWRVTLHTRTGDTEGERTLEDQDCAAIRKATALLLALMIDPNAAPPSDTPPPPPPPEPNPEPKRPPKPTPVRTPPPVQAPERREPEFNIGVDGVVDAGSLPAWAYGGRLTFGLETTHASLDLRSTVWLPRTKVSPSFAGAGGRFTMAEEALALCAGSDRTELIAVGACIGPAVLWMRGVGFGVSNPGSASAFWPAAFVEGVVQIRLSRHVTLRGGAGASAGWGVPTFAIRQVGTIHAPHAVAARAELGLSYGF